MNDPMKEYEEAQARRQQPQPEKRPDPTILRFIIDALRSPMSSMRRGVAPQGFHDMPPQGPQTPPQQGMLEAYHNRMK